MRQCKPSHQTDSIYKNDASSVLTNINFFFFLGSFLCSHHCNIDFKFLFLLSNFSATSTSVLMSEINNDAYRKWKLSTFGSDYMIWHEGLYTHQVEALKGEARQSAIRMLVF